MFRALLGLTNSSVLGDRYGYLFKRDTSSPHPLYRIQIRDSEQSGGVDKSAQADGSVWAPRK